MVGNAFSIHTQRHSSNCIQAWWRQNGTMTTASREHGGGGEPEHTGGMEEDRLVGNQTPTHFVVAHLCNRTLHVFRWGCRTWPLGCHWRPLCNSVRQCNRRRLLAMCRCWHRPHRERPRCRCRPLGGGEGSFWWRGEYNNNCALTAWWWQGTRAHRWHGRGPFGWQRAPNPFVAHLRDWIPHVFRPTVFRQKGVSS